MAISPGPFTTVSPDTNDPEIKGDIGIVDADGTIIGEAWNKSCVGKGGDGKSLQVSADAVSNGMLFAASWQMIDALKDVHNFPEYWANDPDGKIAKQCWQETMDKVRAAVESAEKKVS